MRKAARNVLNRTSGQKKEDLNSLENKEEKKAVDREKWRWLVHCGNPFWDQPKKIVMKQQ